MAKQTKQQKIEELRVALVYKDKRVTDLEKGLDQLKKDYAREREELLNKLQEKENYIGITLLRILRLMPDSVTILFDHDQPTKHTLSLIHI